MLGLLVTAGMVLLSGLHGRVARGQDDWDVGKKAVDQPNRQVRWQVCCPTSTSGCSAGRPATRSNACSSRSSPCRSTRSPARVSFPPPNGRNSNWQARATWKRLYRTIEQFREKFREAGQDQQKYNTVVNEASMLQMKMQSGVYDDSSLFQKVLRQTLNREQSVRYEQRGARATEVPL